jgi:hypothetical protein
VIDDPAAVVNEWRSVMIGRTILVTLTGIAALTLAACDFRSNPVSSAGATNSAPAVSAMPVEVGEPLYSPVVPPQRPAPATSETVMADPIVVRNCQITLPQTQNVPSKNELFIVSFW